MPCLVVYPKIRNNLLISFCIARLEKFLAHAVKFYQKNIKDCLLEFTQKIDLNHLKIRF